MKRSRPASAGLLTAAKRAALIAEHEVPGLRDLRANNRAALVEVAKLAFALADGRPGTAFHLGSVALGTLLGVHQRTAHRWIRQLEELGAIVRTWTGRRVRRDERGHNLPGPLAHDRASEFVYRGFGHLASQSKSVYQSYKRERGTVGDEA